MKLQKQFLRLDIKTIVIIGLIIFLLLRGCGEGSPSDVEVVKVDGEKYELLEKNIDTVYVEKRVEVPKYVPKYITKVDTVSVKIPMDIDTLEIVNQYFATYRVKDTIQLNYDFPEGVTDSLGQKPPSNLGWGVISDDISQNRITNREINWNFKVPTVYNTTIVKDLPKNQVFYGFNLSGNKENILSTASGGLILKTKTDKMYQLNIGVQTNPNTNGVVPYIGGGLYWKINLNKK